MNPEPTGLPVETVPAEHGPRRRWLVVVVSAVAVAAALVGGLTLVNRPANNQPVLAAAAAPAKAKAPAKAAVKSLSPTTDAAIVYRMQQLLPAGKTSGYAASVDPNQLFGQ